MILVGELSKRELFLFQQNDYERLYNCSGLVIDSIPLEQRRLTTKASINLILATSRWVTCVNVIKLFWVNAQGECSKFLVFKIVLERWKALKGFGAHFTRC